MNVPGAKAVSSEWPRIVQVSYYKVRLIVLAGTKRNSFPFSLFTNPNAGKLFAMFFAFAVLAFGKALLQTYIANRGNEKVTLSLINDVKW